MTRSALLLPAALLIAACAPLPEPDPDGTWNVQAICSPRSPLGDTTLTGVARVTETSPNEFVGRYENNLGQKNRLAATLAGDTLKVNMNWVGSGFSQVVLTREGTSDVFTGTDSGCDVTVEK
ncbi:hypothetical protein [uncultured Roseobacter sp.]|uniref:hypothetical protein n=1 Tax=uncultured Roseobacter sp. TaxID=114847 RepID=UPI002608E1E7|nr:hypothetical protein [uncultured Roseobacter sp.]